MRFELRVDGALIAICDSMDRLKTHFPDMPSGKVKVSAYDGCTRALVMRFRKK